MCDFAILRKGADNLTVFMVIEQDATWVANKIGQCWRNMLPLVFYFLLLYGMLCDGDKIQ